MSKPIHNVYNWHFLYIPFFSASSFFSGDLFEPELREDGGGIAAVSVNNITHTQNLLSYLHVYVPPIALLWFLHVYTSCLANKICRKTIIIPYLSCETYVSTSLRCHCHCHCCYLEIFFWLTAGHYDGHLSSDAVYLYRKYHLQLNCPKVGFRRAVAALPKFIFGLTMCCVPHKSTKLPKWLS